MAYVDPFTTALLVERLLWMGGGVAIIFGFTQRNEWVVPVTRRSIRWLIEHRPGANLDRKLDQILHVLYPNGGGSLPDAMARLEIGQACIRDQLFMLKSQIDVVRDQAGLLTYTTDAKGRNAYTSPLLLERLGMTSEEQRGFGWKNCIYPEDRDRYIAEWLYAVEDERDFSEEVRLCNLKHGTCFKCRVTAEVVKIDGKLIGWTGRVELLDK